MPTTTEFDQWLDTNSIEDEEIREELVEALESEKSNSFFQLLKRMDSYF